MRRSLVAALVTAVALSFSVAPARAAEPRCEIGTSLISSVIGLGDNDVATIGVPNGSIFGLGEPGVYASFFLTDRIAVEPQVNALYVSVDDGSGHVIALNGQIDYFLKSRVNSSAYVFGKVGYLNLDVEDAASFGAGVGYRIPKGRLVLRFDGQLIHYTDGGGNVLVFGASIGGLFW